MASNAMYRDLLNEAVNNNKHGSALMGGSRMGGAMMGGYFPKTKKATERKSTISEGERQQRLANGIPGRMSAGQYNKLHGANARAKAEAARERREVFINKTLQDTYGGRKKISYDERADAINFAKKQLHAMKLDDAKTKRDNMSPAEKEEAKSNRQRYMVNSMMKKGFPQTPQGLRDYRKSLNKGPKTQAEKARDKAIREDPEVKAALARARTRHPARGGPRMVPGPLSQAVQRAFEERAEGKYDDPF